MYFKGEGVPEYQAEAVEWYREAALQGHAYAQSLLGFWYATGNGVPRDDVEAVKWYRQAAEQGDARAQSDLGNMYASGRGVTRDPVEACAWYAVAAASGDECARSDLAALTDQLTPDQLAASRQHAAELIAQIHAGKDEPC